MSMENHSLQFIKNTGESNAYGNEPLPSKDFRIEMLGLFRSVDSLSDVMTKLKNF